MKVGIRKQSVKRSISARTTGAVKRSVKKAVNPLYGKKGMGLVTNPKKAVYNKVYNKTTVSVKDVVGGGSSKKSTNSGNYSSSITPTEVKVTSDNISQVVHEHPQVIETLEKQYKKRRNWAIFLLIFGIAGLFSSPFVGVVSLVISAILFYKKGKYKAAYEDAVYYSKKNGDDTVRVISNNVRIVNTEAKKTPVQHNTAFIKAAGGSDNMNCEQYSFSGKYIQTNRMHKNHTIHIFNNEDVKAAIQREGYTEPIEFTKVDFPSASEDQLSYLRDKGLHNQATKLSVDDASAILSRYEDEDVLASESFFKFVASKRIPMSYYMGTRRGYDTLFYRMEKRDRAAFIIFSIYRHMYGISNENMNECPKVDIFYEFADTMLNDDSFMRSMEKIEGSRLRSLGNVYGINRNSVIYKKAYEFLSSKGLAV